jgi:hypothetical protein
MHVTRHGDIRYPIHHHARAVLLEVAGDAFSRLGNAS